MMLQSIRNLALATLKQCGLFALVRDSRWRSQRLLILCYHGIALEDEHRWRPFLYISPSQLDQRLEILKRGNYSVLPLGQALERLRQHDLPPRSVAITFDDGGYDFYRHAYPRLREAGFPVTVYLTSYYSVHEYPIFNLVCSYMLWKRKTAGQINLAEFGVPAQIDLADDAVRQAAADGIVDWAEQQGLSGDDKNQVAARLAARLDINYPQLLSKRLLQLMNRHEVRELADAGVDFQLHTHRHRTPLDEALFRREIRDNQAYLADAAGKTAIHFCYPSGAYRPEFLPWLTAEGVVSATTCDTGLATDRSDPLLLPRLVDTTGRSALTFESWASGVGHFISSRKKARLAYSPD